MRDFVYKLVITCETREEAETILGARIGYDEELEGVGDYSIDGVEDTAVDELIKRARDAERVMKPLLSSKGLSLDAQAILRARHKALFDALAGVSP